MPRPLPLLLSLVGQLAQRQPELAHAALKGIKRYQEAPRGAPRELHGAVLQAGRAALRDYGGSGPPVVFVPSLINPPFVLDLAPGNSLIAHVRSAGYRPLLIDWGAPTPQDRDDDLAAHVEQLALPLIRGLGEPCHLVGYCLGGTLAMAVAQNVPVQSLTLLATPWDFYAYDASQRAALAHLWQDSQAAAATMGFLPMEVLQAAFWTLDPEATVRKFAQIAEADDARLSRFAALEDWANSGAPLPYAAARDLFARCFGGNDVAEGRWKVSDHVVTTELHCRGRQFRSTRDRIVPASSAPPVRTIDVGAGHVGMIVGSQAQILLWDPLISHLGQERETS